MILKGLTGRRSSPSAEGVSVVGNTSNEMVTEGFSARLVEKGAGAFSFLHQFFADRWGPRNLVCRLSSRKKGS
jgi:hypothetical protein